MNNSKILECLKLLESINSGEVYSIGVAQDIQMAKQELKLLAMIIVNNTDYLTFEHQMLIDDILD